MACDTENMEQETLEQRITHIEEKIDRVYVSTEKTRRYFLWTLIVTLVAFILPLLGIALVLPFLFSTLTAAVGL